jgi:hypothetical protein
VLDIQATNISFPTNARGTTAQYGVAQLADAAALRSGVGISGNNDTQRNASIDTAPEVVTVKALEYWRVHNRLLSQRSGVQYVYVDPTSDNDLTTIDQLLAAPPTSASTRVKTLTAAVLYANNVFSSAETVEFRLGPGIYIEAGTLTFNSITRIRAWDFNANTYLNNDKAGGTVPFMGQSSDGKSWSQSRSYLQTLTNHPIFLTRARIDFIREPEEAELDIIPLRFNFNEAATITGVVWWGSMETITNTNVPDSFFISRSAVSAWRPSAQSAPDDALNHLIKTELATSSSSEVTTNGLVIINPTPCISAKSTLSLTNVAFDAMAPADVRHNDPGKQSLILTSGAPIKARGVWLIGNVNISSNLTSAPKLRSQSTYQITGFCRALFGVDESLAPQDGIILNLGGFREIEGGTGTDSDYNFTWNNIHLVNNSLATPTTANDTSPQGTQWKSVGPALQGFLGRPAFVGTTNELLWHEAFVVSATHYQGFTGKFGNWGVYNNAAANYRTKGIAEISDGFTLKRMREHYFLRQAGANVFPADSGYPTNPGEAGTDEAFDALNASVTPISKGIDIVRPLIANINAKL